MKIAYDISVLGAAYYNSVSRTGVFRVVENIAYGLAASEECQVSFCSSLSLESLNQSLDYLNSNPRLKNVSVITGGIEKDIYKILKNLIVQINTKSNVELSLKICRKILYKLSDFIEAKTKVTDIQKIAHQDLFHSPFYPIPETIRRVKKLTFCLTIYDLIPVLFPQFFQFNREHLIKQVLNNLEPEDWIICISNSTKNDLCNYMKTINPDRVFVTHLAASTLFYPCSDAQKNLTVKIKYTIPSTACYFLSLSTLEPRKNIDSIIRCFAKLVQQEHISDLYLVLVGTKGWDYGKIFDEISIYPFLKERVIITGYVADEDLAALYSGALAFVYPSFYEGFGLPPLEAMQCGVPVITSNTSSLPEVVGDAGIMVSPTDTDALCQSMLKVYDNPSLRAAMSLKSLKRAKQFSWEKCTQATINVYKSALDS